MKKTLFFASLLLALSCSRDNSENASPFLEYNFDYEPSELFFPAEGGVDSVWTRKVTLVLRDDSMVAVGNSGKNIFKESLPGDTTRHYWTWYSIKASNGNNGNMGINIEPNPSTIERKEHLVILVDNYLETLPHIYYHITIRQEGRK
ncbi:MAG: hypothetical protein IKH86_01220 [Prevotella sp.]|nr:hypothetical protein [Prevotella sp.]